MWQVSQVAIPKTTTGEDYLGVPFHLELPQEAQILRCGQKGAQAWVWYRHDVDAPVGKRFFLLAETGVPYPSPGDFDFTFVDSFRISRGLDTVVRHLFELHLAEVYDVTPSSNALAGFNGHVSVGGQHLPAVREVSMRRENS